MGINAYLAEKDCQHFINEYWQLTGQQKIIRPPVHILPDGSVELVFNYGDPYKVTINGKEFLIEGGNVYLRGVSVHSITLQMGHKIDIWGVRLNPLWVQSYLGVNLKDSFEQVVQLENLKVPKNIELMDENSFIAFFSEQVDWNQKEQLNPSIQTVVERIEFYQGQVKIVDLAKECCLSTSALERNFKKTLGLSPKAYAQLIRFKYIAIQMATDKKTKQLNLIHEHELTDHSHLNKITKSFSKETPENLKSKISRFFTKAYFVDDVDLP